MQIEFETVKKGLDFYEIRDKVYIDKCKQCVSELNSLPDFNIKAEQIYNILYNDTSGKINELWKIQNKIDLFGENYNPFITSVLILLGYYLHEKNMKIKKFDEDQQNLHKKRVLETLINDIYIKHLDSVRISQMLWASYFINVKIIEVGRLQYEDCENYIKIHIPSGEKLEIDKVLKSLKNSKKEIKKYFNINNPKYRCNSWLLSNQINTIIDANSNIAKFYKLFNVQDGPDATKDVLNFVFEEHDNIDYKNLKENTTLQKLLKKQLLSGNVITIGLGELNTIK